MKEGGEPDQPESGKEPEPKKIPGESGRVIDAEVTSKVKKKKT